MTDQPRIKRRTGPTAGRCRTAEERAAISRGVAYAQGVRRLHEHVSRRDLVRLDRPGAELAPSLVPFRESAQAEADELVRALGGPGDVSPQERFACEDFGRLGLALRGARSSHCSAWPSARWSWISASTSARGSRPQEPRTRPSSTRSRAARRSQRRRERRRRRPASRAERGGLVSAVLPAELRPSPADRECSGSWPRSGRTLRRRSWRYDGPPLANGRPRLDPPAVRPSRRT